MDTSSERDVDAVVLFEMEPEVEEMARLRVDNDRALALPVIQHPMHTLASEREQTQSAASADRQHYVVTGAHVAGFVFHFANRMAANLNVGVFTMKSTPLQKKIDTLQLQIRRNSELHQIELKERDVQLAQLRRQLKYAAAEEEETRNELRAAVSEHSSEKLQFQKKIVELDSKLRFLESSLNEWRERALENESQLRTVTRQSKLKIQLLEDQLEIASTAADAAKATLVERDSTLQSASSSLARGMERAVNARDVGALNGKIERLETAERALKAEVLMTHLVDLIESSKQASALEEQLYQVEKQLQASEERNAEAQKRIESYKVLEKSHLQTQPVTNLAESSMNPLVQPVDEEMKQMESSHEALAIPPANAKNELRVAHLEGELVEVKRQNGNLTKHLEKVEMELAVLEKRLGKGEFNAETTKIVHLSVNPTSETIKSKNKTSEVEKLRQENELLRFKLERMSGGADVKMIPAAAPTSAFTTTTSYETVEGQKLLNKRLKEVFREQIQHYREAVHLLTGFKIDLRKSSGMELLRLRSVYADHEDDELLVRMEADSALELLETDFCARVPQRVLAYLTTCRSFPAFLATLTLHLFEKQTFQGN